MPEHSTAPKNLLQVLEDAARTYESEYAAIVAEKGLHIDDPAQYEDLQPSEWPAISFNWDTAKESQRFSLDGTGESQFAALYPEGFALGWVDLEEFDRKLGHFSRRDTPEELWELGSKHKLARMLCYLAKGHPISPPLAKPIDDGTIVLQGGHHRYAVAKVAAVPRLPIHVEPEYRDAISKLIPVSWSDA